MKRFLIFFFLIFLTGTCLFGQDNFYGKVQLSMIVQDETAAPVVTIVCTNKSESNVFIPEVFLKKDYMSSSYFQFEPLYKDFFEEIPKYKGEWSVIPEKDLKKNIKLKPNKSVSVSYSLCDFYDFPEEMLSSVILFYCGPLGTCSKQFLHLESLHNQYDFEVKLNCHVINNELIAELEYIYKGLEPKFYKKDYFITTENFPGSVFDLEINDKEIEFTGSFYDSFGMESQIKDLRICSKGDIIKTEVQLNSFYEIPETTDIQKLRLVYKGYLGAAEVVN